MVGNNNKISVFFKGRSNVILAWLVIFLFFFVSSWSGFVHSLIHSVFLTLCLMFTSFIEIRYIVKLLQKGHPFLFYIINIILVVIMSGITVHIELIMLKFISKHVVVTMFPYTAKEFFMSALVKIVIYMATVAISAISVLQRMAKENQRVKNELESEKLDMELRFLKSQISPHFLFNALNNIYSLVYIKDEKAPQSLLKLSDMLRYVMVDCHVDMISLEKEIKYIDAFIDFQQMSMENKSNVVFEKKIKNNKFKIPPMLLQPLVENSFKHSRLENDPDGFIRFSLIQNDDALIFKAVNSIKGMSVSVVDTNNKKHQHGIGLANVKKRLDLYYGENYSFEMKQEDATYMVMIKIGDKFNEKKV